MIIEVNDLRIVDMIIENAKGIEGLDVKKLKPMLIESMFESHKFMMADIERSQLKGFMFATVEKFDGENVAFIQACHSVKEGNVQTMLDKLIEWGKSIHLKNIVFMTKRNPEAWKRKYKFEPAYTVMVREIL